jgi:hypothetical protein
MPAFMESVAGMSEIYSEWSRYQRYAEVRGDMFDPHSLGFLPAHGQLRKIQKIFA